MKTKKRKNNAKTDVSGSKIWASSDRTNEMVEKIMWHTDNVMLPKFYLR